MYILSICGCVVAIVTGNTGNAGHAGTGAFGLSSLTFRLVFVLTLAGLSSGTGKITEITSTLNPLPLRYTSRRVYSTLANGIFTHFHAPSMVHWP
ncbi:hypothetical protein DPMN_053181 [Dreissena polymorpha]|uniref:Uncharacterized protein n=1 Tax=Dreissena polymorpha TaxID=45954 RepID=A0A9D4CN92_DREPO|nr:hypothetical protein DPMN_053181 [Dreissena polymorpha]